MVKRKWTKESIVLKLRELAGDHQDVSPKALRQDYPGLYQAGWKLFDGTTGMYEAAGLPLSVRNRMPKDYWTKERVLTMLRDRYSSGKEISYRALAKGDQALLGACNTRFGTVYKAARAAGVPVDGVRLRKASVRQVSQCRPAGYWTEERVLQAIQKLYSGVERLSSADARRTHHHLVTQAERRGGGWYKACEKAGIPREKFFFKRPDGTWNRDEVIREIIQLRKVGKDLGDAAIRRTNPALQGAAYIHFGSWYNALDSAGIRSDQYRKQAVVGFWTRDRITEAIKAMYAGKEEINARHVYLKHGDLFIAASRVFGSYENAVNQSGIDYGSIRKKHKDYTKDELLAFLRSLHSKGILLHISSVKEVSESKVIVITKRFGSYKAAIEALGLDYAQIRKDFAAESGRGRLFEDYLHQALEALGWDIQYQRNVRFGKDRLRPDFVDLRTGTWIDAKLSSYSGGVSATVRKYQRHKKKVEIIYLEGNERVWPDGSVDFIPVSNFYEALRQAGAENLVRDFEMLKKGVVRPDMQSGLDGYMNQNQ